ncbi:MAG: carboxylating nicotinate-nucleotide diphosphorylase [Proteobacteria bacterium]|nr:carboxylating nicotinate-nucleotide diphosphorylase [Pseudomonadota bacterium]
MLVARHIWDLFMFDSALVQKIVDLALEEDLSTGDITSTLTVPEGKAGQAELLAKEPMVVCGLPLVELILSRVTRHPHKVKLHVAEGQKVPKGTVLATLHADLRGLLAAERTILNFIQRLSGIASMTARVCAKARGLTVLDSRKTTPGLRALEKYAVRTGGGRNHRFSLGDMVLVKNNHIDANGGSVSKTLAQIRDKAPLYMPIEVEVRSIAELTEALPFHPTVVMLDNMNDREIVRALAVIAKSGVQVQVEISGGVTAERLPNLKALGITIASMGALTTKAQNVDISLRIKN